MGLRLAAKRLQACFYLFIEYLGLGIWLFVLILEGDQMILLAFLKLLGCVWCPECSWHDMLTIHFLTKCSSLWDRSFSW